MAKLLLRLCKSKTGARSLPPHQHSRQQVGMLGQWDFSNMGDALQFLGMKQALKE